MEFGAGAFLQKTFYRFFSLPRIFSGLLRLSRAPLRLSLEDGLGEGPFKRDTIGHFEERKQSDLFQHGSSLYSRVCSPQIDESECGEHSTCKVSEDDDVPYADGPSRIVLHDDGPTDYLSMLLTEDMVSKICSAGKDRRALEQAERMAQDADLELNEAVIRVGTFHSVLERAQDEDELCKFEREQKSYAKKLDRARRRCAAIDKELKSLKVNEKRSTSQLQNMLEHILENAGLVDLVSLEPQTADQQTPSEDGSSVAVKSESIAPSCDELFRRTVEGDLTNAKWAYIDAEKDFDDRRYYYEDQLQRYEKYAKERQASVTRTEFDGHLFIEMNTLTRDVIEAEDRLNAARADAKVLGLPDQWEEMLNGTIDPGDDGYRESEEAAVIAGVDRHRIRRWRQEVNDSTDLPEFDARKDIDLDEWDAESVGVSDSCSAVDWMEYGPKIAVWQKSCRALRDQLRLEAGVSNRISSEPFIRPAGYDIEQMQRHWQTLAAAESGGSL